MENRSQKLLISWIYNTFLQAFFFFASFKQKFTKELHSSETFRCISQDWSYPVSGRHHWWSTQYSPVVWSPSSYANKPFQRCQKGDSSLSYSLFLLPICRTIAVFLRRNQLLINSGDKILTSLSMYVMLFIYLPIYRDFYTNLYIFLWSWLKSRLLSPWERQKAMETNS